MQRVICAGLIAADLVFDVDAFPVKGSKHRAGGARLITGGGALNAASAIAALGGVASLAGVVGDDMFGDFLRRAIHDRGIDDRYLTTVTGAGTSCSANLISPDEDRTIINHRDGSLTPDLADLPANFPFDAALVDTRWAEGAAHVVAAARKAGKPAVVDAEAPVALARTALEGASHVVFSEQGLADFAGACDGAALARATTQLSGWCAVTRGGAPVLSHDGQRLSQHPVFPAVALNTLGAGDVWHGAFALALARQMPEPDAVRFANAAASLKVRRPVDDETWPGAAEVAALIEG